MKESFLEALTKVVKLSSVLLQLSSKRALHHIHAQCKQQFFFPLISKSLNSQPYFGKRSESCVFSGIIQYIQ